MGGQQYPEGAAGFRVCFVGGGSKGQKPIWPGGLYDENNI